MVWTRPPQPPVPTVWHTFKAKDVDSDQQVVYRVQDLTEDRYEDLIQLFLDHFLEDEPIAVSKGITKNSPFCENMIKLWTGAIKEQMTIVCYKEGSDEIVGANMIVIRGSGGDFNEEMPSDDEGDFMSIIKYVAAQFNPLEHYGVDHRVTAYGLVVNKRYRGRGIATEILKARVPMCKAFGIKLCAHNFSAPGSQGATRKAGYRTDYEITYDKLAEMGPKYTLRGIPSKSIKVMSLWID
ncbi:uncharacterized protein LOC131433912 [Malaya genurostris]|uniref:uncharacterized protein LOC131433912 n=1 Tax=Malaya genurostris TaxID=325434 RepID=UPI0026F3F0AC|nr:uncharacterized protein LOC131433912 [Malaya genurostris]